MSARNLVRNLRDSGALPNRPAGPDWRSGAIFFGAALTFGAIVYLGVAFALPGLMHAMERKPPPVTYAKAEADPLVALAADAKPFTRTDELACIRYGEAARTRAARAKAKKGFSFDLGGTRYAELGGKLVCEAQTRPMRLCDPAERALFIERAQPYFKEVEMMASMMGMSMSSPAFALMPRGGQASKELFGQMASDTLGTIAAEHQKVAQAFRDLAVRGLVSVDDFGGGIFGPSAAVKPIFKDMPPVEDVCSPA
jgi:hypothetical protein